MHGRAVTLFSTEPEGLTPGRPKQHPPLAR